MGFDGEGLEDLELLGAIDWGHIFEMDNNDIDDSLGGVN